DIGTPDGECQVGVRIAIDVERIADNLRLTILDGQTDGRASSKRDVERVTIRNRSAEYRRVVSIKHAGAEVRVAKAVALHINRSRCQSRIQADVVDVQPNVAGSREHVVPYIRDAAAQIQAREHTVFEQH